MRTPTFLPKMALKSGLNPALAITTTTANDSSQKCVTDTKSAALDTYTYITYSSGRKQHMYNRYLTATKKSGVCRKPKVSLVSVIKIKPGFSIPFSWSSVSFAKPPDQLSTRIAVNKQSANIRILSGKSIY